MNRLILAILTIFMCSVCNAQTIDTKYYNNQTLDKEVAKEKAKFSKTITQDTDGKITTSKKDIKKDRIIWSETFKGEEPFGVWIYQRASGTGELNYEFQLVYSKAVCPIDKELDKIDNYFQDNEAIGYKAPKLETDNMYEFIGRNLIYPAFARRRGIQGVVNATLTIKADGTVDNVIVNKGVNIHLDKEAVRILRELKFSSPPLLNGQSIDVCVEIPITFRLG